MGNLTNHGKWSAETAEQEEEESKASGVGANFFKPKTGKNKIRFLPPRAGKASPFVIAWEHYINQPGQQAIKFACPRYHEKRPCPACSKADVLRASGNDVDFKAAGNLIAKRRIYANIIDRTAPERGVLIFPFGKTVHEQLLALRKNEEAGGDFTDPGPEGFDIILDKSGQMLNTEYKVFPDRKNSALGSDEWLEAMHDLDRLVKVPSEEELAKMMGGAGMSSSSRSSSGGGRGSAGGGPKRRSAADDAMGDDE